MDDKPPVDFADLNGGQDDEQPGADFAAFADWRKGDETNAAEPLDDQFFGSGDAEHPENGELNLGHFDDARYSGHHPENGERLLGEMVQFDDVVTGRDDVPDHTIGAHHEVGQQAVVKCTTTAGPVIMRFHRSWSPHGYDRVASLFERGYYDHSHFFRVVPHFLVQFGISYTMDAELNNFADKSIQDDPKRDDLLPFREGMLSFAGSGPNSRTSQLFIAYDRAGGLGQSPWETPFGEVVEGMDNIKNLYSGYGDMPPWGKGPQQGPIRNRGSSYIEENFSLLDKFETCTLKRMESSLDGSGMVGDHDAVTGTVEDHSAMRGGEVKARATKEKRALRSFPQKNNGDATVADKQSPLFGKIIIIVVVLVTLSQLLARRKKNKQAEKSV
mmetsp:Transcript_3459/g.6327  ORF Transcript_3459/g.6327 Transcript_3459/m.6327 type:complete len:386 (+) Transcript_3459:110-1267(+)